MPSWSKCTGVSGSRRKLSFRRTWPVRISSAACVREQYPNFESARASPRRRDFCFGFIEIMLLQVPLFGVRWEARLNQGCCTLRPRLIPYLRSLNGYGFEPSARSLTMAHQHPPRFLKIVDDAKTRVRATNVDEVKSKLDHGEKFVLVDVREESEFAKDHLPGAIHLGKGVIERDIEARVPKLDTRWCFTAVAVSGLLWRPTTCRKRVIRTSFPWTAVFATGGRRGVR